MQSTVWKEWTGSKQKEKEREKKEAKTRMTTSGFGLEDVKREERVRNESWKEKGGRTTNDKHKTKNKEEEEEAEEKGKKTFVKRRAHRRRAVLRSVHEAERRLSREGFGDELLNLVKTGAGADGNRESANLILLHDRGEDAPEVFGARALGSRASQKLDGAVKRGEVAASVSAAVAFGGKGRGGGRGNGGRGGRGGGRGRGRKNLARDDEHVLEAAAKSRIHGHDDLASVAVVSLRRGKRREKRLVVLDENVGRAALRKLESVGVRRGVVSLEDGLALLDDLGVLRNETGSRLVVGISGLGRAEEQACHGGGKSSAPAVVGGNIEGVHDGRREARAQVRLGTVGKREGKGEFFGIAVKLENGVAGDARILPAVELGDAERVVVRGALGGRGGGLGLGLRLGRGRVLEREDRVASVLSIDHLSNRRGLDGVRQREIKESCVGN